jgi:hypothetical protein
MSAATNAPPSDTPSYFETALKAIVQQPQCSDDERLRVNDCLTFMQPVSTHNTKGIREASRLRLVDKISDILAAGEKNYTIHHALKMAARILSSRASPAEQSILREHGVVYQTAYRLSGIPNDSGTLRDSTFASKKDNGYRLVHFDSQGHVRKKDITEIGMRSRFGLTEGFKEKEIRRKPCGTSCSGLDKVTNRMRDQHGTFWTDKWDDIGSPRQRVTESRALFKFEGSSVSGADSTSAKTQLWGSKYNHEMRRKDEAPARVPDGRYEMLGGRLVADILFAREPECDTVKSLQSIYPDLSQAMLLDCEVTEKGLSIAQSSFFFPADPDTWQSVDPSDQFYDLVSIDNGKIVSVVEHSVGEMVGKLRIGDKSTKSGPSKRRGQAESSENTKRPRVEG